MLVTTDIIANYCNLFYLCSTQCSNFLQMALYYIVDLSSTGLSSLFIKCVIVTGPYIETTAWPQKKYVHQ